MYIQSQLTSEIRNNLGVVIPQDDSLELWHDFNSWRIAGGEIIYVDYFEGEQEQYERSLLPKIVSQRQLRTQLVLNGFNLDAIQTAINGLSEPDKSIAQIAWDYAITFERNSPLLVIVAQMLGLTESDIDTIFLNASSL